MPNYQQNPTNLAIFLQGLKGIQDWGALRQEDQNKQAELALASQESEQAAKLQEQLKGEALLKNAGLAKLLVGQFPGRGVDVSGKSEGVTVSPALNKGMPILTPAQEAAEKTAGQKVAAFENGGNAQQQANMQQVQGIQQQLQQGQRDQWDRLVGGALENHPTLMSLLAPTEKSRRDQVQNAFMSALHDAGIPRPTQWDIQRIFGQVYDPASDDTTNINRLQTAYSKLQQQNAASQAQANRYRTTGYATLGAPQNSTSATPNSPMNSMGAGMQNAIQGRQLSDQDQQALNWAKSNPNDPRATKIISVLGQ